MRAIILAGGEGRRLKPYTNVLPKPLIPITDVPILEIVIRQLKYYGFKHITISLGYLSDLIENYFQDGLKIGVKIDYIKEDSPLGTAGPLSLLKELDNDPVLVMNGDILTTINFSQFFNFHLEGRAEMTIATVEKEIKISLGVLGTDEHGNVLKVDEKPSYTYLASTGIYVINSDIIRTFIHKKMDVPELILLLINNLYKVKSYKTSSRWFDIGKLEDYNLAVEEFYLNRSLYLPTQKRKALRIARKK